MMTASNVMNVCLFGGSFDPVHAGHVSIVNELCKRYDEVWVIISNNPRNNISFHENFDDRKKMCDLAFTSPFVKVLDIEKKEKIKFTYDLIEFLRKKYNYSFSFAIGSDHYPNLHRWYKYEEINEIVTFEIIRRNNNNIFTIELSNDFTSKVSRISKKTGLVSVDNYIRKKKLYISKYDIILSHIKIKNDINYYNKIYELNFLSKISQKYNINEENCIMAILLDSNSLITFNVEKEVFKLIQEVKNMRKKATLDAKAIICSKIMSLNRANSGLTFKYASLILNDIDDFYDRMWCSQVGNINTFLNI